MGKVNIVISPSQQVGNKTVVKEAPNEAILMRGITFKLSEILSQDSRLNCIVIPIYTGTESEILRKVVNFSNLFVQTQKGQSYHLCLHSDGGYEGHGASGFYASEAGAAFGKPIFDRMCKLTPHTDMTLSKRTCLYELKHTTATAFLLETSFHDSQTEGYWIYNNEQKIAETIADGIYEGIGLDRKRLIPQWQYEAFKKAVELGLIKSPEYWEGKLATTITVGEVFALLMAQERGHG